MNTDTRIRGNQNERRCISSYEKPTTIFWYSKRYCSYRSSSRSYWYTQHQLCCLYVSSPSFLHCYWVFHKIKSAVFSTSSKTKPDICCSLMRWFVSYISSLQKSAASICPSSNGWSPPCMPREIRILSLLLYRPSVYHGFCGLPFGRAASFVYLWSSSRSYVFYL